ncbi:hypothetical protein [Pseudovibrio exalbescens]|uniref:hypothetical protein n=1 Tax=Pseudovibrio exalbescens TaxID=197461 RepID=UPI000C9B9192|nr:hypothetical protein [Pseudovibrio exalbescens]
MISWRTGLLVGAILVPMTGYSADMPQVQPPNPQYRPCTNINQPIPDPSSVDWEQTLNQIFQEANQTVLNGHQGQGTQQNFIWAQATRDWCGVAIGYSKEGVWDVEAVNRCLCFRTLMQPNAR